MEGHAHGFFFSDVCAQGEVRIRTSVGFGEGESGESEIGRYDF